MKHLIIFCVFLAISLTHKYLYSNETPTPECQQTILVKDRSETSGGNIRYFITVSNPEGGYEQYEVDSFVYKSVNENDVGCFKAYEKNDRSGFGLLIVVIFCFLLGLILAVGLS